MAPRLLIEIPEDQGEDERGEQRFCSAGAGGRMERKHTVWYACLPFSGSFSFINSCTASAVHTIVRLRALFALLFAHVAHKLRVLVTKVACLLACLASPNVLRTRRRGKRCVQSKRECTASTLAT